MNGIATGAPPWHMWGNSTQGLVEVPGTGQFDARTTQQITQVRYGRPDTWKFLLAARIFNYVDLTPGAAQKFIQVTFEIQIGLGLITTVLPLFEHFQYRTVPPDAVQGDFRWSTEVLSPPAFIAPVTADAQRTFTRELPAQNIQVAATVSGAIVLGEPYSFNFEVSAQFAPKNHIRPEWFEGLYPGGEDKGR